MEFDLRHVSLHPAPQKVFAAAADITGIIEQAVFGMDEGLRLPKPGHIEISQHVVKMLLRQRGADGSWSGQINPTVSGGIVGAEFEMADP